MTCSDETLNTNADVCGLLETSINTVNELAAINEQLHEDLRIKENWVLVWASLSFFMFFCILLSIL